jgi:nitroimidazol reductase NimA-like FMN-containing flavoprotein (pyridoxamine 5'-phosphate oxidase superfamily)
MATTPTGAPTLEQTDRSRLRRRRERGSFDRAVADAVLDEALIAHVATVTERGPVVLPMAHARVGEHLYVHGAPANALLRALAAGAPACVTVTLLDGLVLARSAFHHSMNYRSVVLFGVMEKVDDGAEKRAASAALVEHLVPGRSAEARMPTDAELEATLFLRLAIREGSVKVRTGPPVDDEADLDWPVWAGHVPVRPAFGEPVAAPEGQALDVPDAVWALSGRARPERR